MKETVFDVLMYLFENYYMDEEQPVSPDQASMEQELQSAGFPAQEITQAFNWLEGLARNSSPSELPTGNSIRLFSRDEMDRLDTRCRGLLLFLDQMGVLTPSSREHVIEQAMALENEDFDIEQMKWVVLMVLFNQPGEEAAYAWMEDMVFENTPANLH